MGSIVVWSFDRVIWSREEVVFKRKVALFLGEGGNYVEQLKIK